MSTICDDLRTSIIDAAFQGKLTKQSPEDGDANTLLKQLEMEKEQLIKDRVIKKQKELPPISDNEIPYAIPDDWKWIRFNDFFEVSGGSQPPKSKFIFEPKDGYVRLYQTRDYGKNPQPVYIPIKTASKTTKKGDILLARYGGSLGKVFFAEDGAYNVAMAKVIRLFQESSIDTKYLYYFFHTNLYRSVIFQNNRSAQAGFNKDDLNILLFPLPPLAEQKRIVEKVDELMARVADLEQSADTLALLKKAFPDDIKASLLQYAMQGKLTKQLPEDGNAEDLLTHRHDDCSKKHKSTAISENEKPFSIPSTWQWIRIGDFFETITGGTPSKTHSEYYGGDYAFFKPSDLDAGKYITDTSEYLTEAGRMVSRQLPANTILICCIGSIGKVAIMGIEGTTNQQINAILPNDSVDIEYLYYAIKSPVFFEKIWSLASSTTISIVNKSKMDSIIIPLPPLAEQKRIVERLNSLMQNINAVGELIASE